MPLTIQILVGKESFPFEAHPCETCESVARRFVDGLVSDLGFPEPPSGRIYLRDGLAYPSGAIGEYMKAAKAPRFWIHVPVLECP